MVLETMHYCMCQPKMFMKNSAQFPPIADSAQRHKAMCWATVTFLDLSTTLQVVIIHDV